MTYHSITSYYNIERNFGDIIISWKVMIYVYVSELLSSNFDRMIEYGISIPQKFSDFRHE